MLIYGYIVIKCYQSLYEMRYFICRWQNILFTGGKFLKSSELEDLKILRDKVAKITFEIIRLSSERLALAKKIGEIKARNNIPIEDPAVENDLKLKVMDFSRKHGIDEEFSLKILELLLEESKRVQREALEPKNHRE